MNRPHAVLFDLDGTLLDTAADIIHALNHVLESEGHAPQALSSLRSRVYGGSKTLLSHVLQMDEDHPQFKPYQQALLAYYNQHYAIDTEFFPGIPAVLDQLDQQQIPWGVVTNKPELSAKKVLAAFNLTERSRCLIAGDTLSVAKPNPEPILVACKQLNVQPQHTLYLGDSLVDVQAANDSGAIAVIANYGYIPEESNSTDWPAQHLIEEPLELLKFFE